MNSGLFIGVFMTIRHYLQLSKYLLACTRRNNDRRDALISVLKLDYCRSLEPGRLARALSQTAPVIQPVSF